jgi:hypothetical protein
MTRRRTHVEARWSARHRGQGGLTLSELLVCVAVLTIIGTVVSITFDIGFKTIGPAGADDRLSGSNTISALEQSLGTDVGRASCVEQPGGAVYGGNPPAVPNCARILPTSGSRCTTAAVPGAFLCLAWPQPLDQTCHLAVYSRQNLDTAHPTVYDVYRQEWSLKSGTLSSVGTSRVTIGGVTTPTVTVTTTTLPEGYTWVTSVGVSVASTAVTTNVPAGSFTLRPLVQDPAAGYASC